MAQRDEGDAGPSLRTGRAQISEEPVVGPCSSEREFGVELHACGETGVEGWRAHAGYRIRIGEQHVGGHAVGIELLIADRRVVGAAKALFVGGLPPHDELVIRLELELALRFLLRDPGRERRTEPRVEIPLVLVDRKTAVAVRRDDDVLLIPHDSPSGSLPLDYFTALPFTHHALLGTPTQGFGIVASFDGAGNGWRTVPVCFG